MTSQRSDWLTLMNRNLPSVALGYRYEVQLGKMLDEKKVTGEHLRPYLRNVDIQWGNINVDDLPQMDFDAADRTKFALRAGDILVCEGGEIGRAAVWEGAPGLEEVYYQKALHRLRPITSRDEFPRFMYWCLHAAAAQNAYADGGKSTIAHLPADAFRRVRFPKPSRDEQERIANFLDEQTARIDALIAEKERLVSLLEQATWDEVTRAVTGGIKGAATRATGIDWCPAIPRHWDVVLLKRLFVRTEYGLSESMNSEGAVAVLRMGNVREGRVHLTDLKFVDSVPDGLLLEPRDLLYNRTNSLAQVGKVGMLREFPEFPLTFASYLVRLVPNERALPEYLNYLLNCPDVLSIARSLALPAIGQANLNPTRYGYIYVPIPPASEQSAIVEHLDRCTTAIEQLSVHACEHISRLREYRSSLISAAVTGLIDSNTYNKNAGDSRVAA